MSEPVVRVRGLGKCYRLYSRPFDRLREVLSPTRAKYGKPFWALQELDLDLHRGETIGLLGANGSGKSTTLKLLAHKLTPSAGTVEVKGHVSSILELGTGFQAHLTGRQNAEVSALLLGHPPWALDALVEKILGFAEIGEHADQPLSTYSTGMQARLGFATLTTLDPEILILDEALATGDARFAQKCNDFLRGLCESGCTTIVASHDVRFLVSACDRIVLLERGRKVADGSPAAVAQRYLDSLGHSPESLAGRPKHALLRLQWAEPVPADTPLLVHRIDWLAQGKVIGEHHLGDEPAWAGLLDAAGAFGFSPEQARRSWKKTTLVDSSLSRIAQLPPPPDAAYLTLSPPPPPWPIPDALRVVLYADAPADVVLSLQVGGVFHELGRAGRRTEPPAFTSVELPLRGVLEGAPARA